MTISKEARYKMPIIIVEDKQYSYDEKTKKFYEIKEIQPTTKIMQAAIDYYQGLK
jgi:uncharacterized membrane protein